MSARNIAISAPVTGELGDPVSANFDEVGLVRGHVGRLIDGGFCMDIDYSANDIEKLACRIEWIKKKAALGVPDSRSHKRVIPRNPHSTLVLPDGKLVSCFVIDMSASGAAISADYRPPLGTPLAVGKVVARVVRRIEMGFAVQFLATHELDTLEHYLVRKADDLE